MHVKIFRIVDPQNRRSSFRGENFRHCRRVTDIAVAGAEHTLNRGIDSIEFGPAPAIEFLHVKRTAMQFFLLRKIRRRTGNTPRGLFVQTCIPRLPRERLRHLADGSDGVKGVPQGEKLAHGKPGSPYSTLLRPRNKGSRFRRKRFPPARCCRGRNSCPRKDAPGRSGAECNRPSQFATVLQNGVPRSVIVRRSVPFPERNRDCQLKFRNC